MPNEPAQNTLCTKRTKGWGKRLISLPKNCTAQTPYTTYRWGGPLASHPKSPIPAGSPPVAIKAARPGWPDVP